MDNTYMIILLSGGVFLCPNVSFRNISPIIIIIIIIEMPEPCSVGGQGRGGYGGGGP